MEANKSKEKIELNHHRKPLFDKGTVFHFLFGCGLGLILIMLIDNIVLTFILGIVLIPILEYSAHKIFTGYATLKTKNAMADLLFAGLGFVLILLILRGFNL